MERLNDVPGHFRRRLATLERMVSAIEARGGRVAIVKFPVARAIANVHRANFPRAAFWDTIDSLAGVTTVHYLDHASLRGFSLPDASHLDSSEKDRFTAALIEVLRGRGFFEPMQEPPDE